MLEYISQEEIRSVQKSWLVVSTQPREFAEAYYQLLFSRHPQYRALFSQAINDRGDMLMKLLNIIINGIEVWDKLEPELIKLGQFHGRIAPLQQTDYDNVADTIIDVICQFRHDELLEEGSQVCEAWHKIFRRVSEVMLRGQQLLPANDEAS